VGVAGQGAVNVFALSAYFGRFFAARFDLTDAGGRLVSAEVGDDQSMLRAMACCVLALAALARPAAAADDRAALDALIEQHASANALPVALVRQVIRRESNFNPHAVYRGN
jgi:soluble lytic murein transglycosylase-like protein